MKLNQFKGDAFGTTYSVQFIATSQHDFSSSFDSIVKVINKSMSTYDISSDISKINKGDTTVVVDSHFTKVFHESLGIYKDTDGYFDPTVGVLVNAWDFGPDTSEKSLDSLKIENMLSYVGFEKLKLDNQTIVKQDARVFIDFNALAKGYAVDVFANFIENKGIVNYLVEIGGEISAKGKNNIKSKPWKIGVEDPNFDGTQSYTKVVELHDASMATSGGYRKFKVDKTGKRYIHILNPKTGYPIKSSLLAVSVITKKCMRADAYATAFMSMGLTKSLMFLENNKDVKAYFIFENEKGELDTLSQNGF